MALAAPSARAQPVSPAIASAVVSQVAAAPARKKLAIGKIYKDIGFSTASSDNRVGTTQLRAALTPAQGAAMSANGTPLAPMPDDDASAPLVASADAPKLRAEAFRRHSYLSDSALGNAHANDERTRQAGFSGGVSVAVPLPQ